MGQGSMEDIDRRGGRDEPDIKRRRFGPGDDMIGPDGKVSSSS